MRSREYGLDFRERAGRTRTRGIGLLSPAALLWARCAVLLSTMYGTANEGVRHGDHCANERDRPEAPAVLGLSTPVSAVGVALFTTGTPSRRMSAHAEAMREPDRVADAQAAGSATA
ncbi:hypothetical protein [Streptomyces antibioticus]|uniref:hypothetical protein n=1 Tax=Streptomyces antibioticus TaxID=1890 RepID=UPI0033DCD7A1